MNTVSRSLSAVFRALPVMRRVRIPAAVALAPLMQGVRVCARVAITLAPLARGVRVHMAIAVASAVLAASMATNVQAAGADGNGGDRKSTRLNSSHYGLSRMPSSA